MHATHRASFAALAVRPTLASLAALAFLAAGCAARPAGPAARPQSAASARSATPPAAAFKAAAPVPASASPARSYGARCRARQLQLTPGPRVSEATQQDTVVLLLRNRSQSGCDLGGYPEIVLIGSAGERLGYRYRDGGDQMLSSARPRLVALAPGGAAYLAVNQDTCNAAESHPAVRALVRVPGVDALLTVALSRYPVLFPCPPGQPGHVLDITPVEPSERALAARH